MPTRSVRAGILARRFTNESVLFGIAGLVVGGAGNLLLAGEGGLAITVLLLVLFTLSAALFTVTRSRDLAAEVANQVMRLQLASSWIYDPKEAKDAYDRSSRVIREARSKISIFSQHTPNDKGFHFSEGRALHFAAIEDLIRLRLAGTRPDPLLYRRAIQHEEAATLLDTRLRSDLFGTDRPLFDHCDRVFDLLRGTIATNVRVEFLLCEDVPSAPSVMVVDDDHVLVSLLTRELNPSTGNMDIYSGGLLLIDDRVGRTVEGFDQVLSGLMRGGKVIAPTWTAQHHASPAGVDKVGGTDTNS